MQSRTYSDLFDLIQALCGVVFSSIESARIKAFVNRRATRAYKASNYWTRFLKIGECRDVVDGVIAFTQSGKDGIDTFLRIFPFQPYKTVGGGEYEYNVGPTGAQLLTGNYSPQAAYVVYKAQKPTTYGSSSPDETEIPEEWFEYIAHGVYADYLRAEGQQEKAAMADAEALDILQDELMKLSEQHTHTIVANRIFTNANMQIRDGGGMAVAAADTGACGDGDSIVYESGELIISEG